MFSPFRLSLISALLALTLLSASAADTGRPNIICLITDDQRFDMMGNVNPQLITPEMDRLVAGGVRFERAFATTPICAASRASLLTGLYERTHRSTFKTPPLASAFVNASYPRLMRDAGYRTGYVGKFGVTVHPGAVEKLYDSFVRVDRSPYWKKLPDGTRKHATDIEGEKAIAFIDAHAREHAEQPFCLTVGFNAPHAEDADPQQYFWQDEVDNYYRDARIPDPPLSSPAFYDNLPPFLRDGTMNRQRWHWRFDFPQKRREMIKGYYRMISGVDLVIGRIRKALEERGLAENTVILLIGDNGYFLGERGYADKWLPYDQSIHIPLILFDPTGRYAKPGGKPKAFALNIDVAPTLLEIAGVRPSSSMQGRSLLALAKGEPAGNWRSDFFIEHLMMEESIRKHEGVRNERYRYSRYFEAEPMIEELYDLQEDPWETVNLINSPKHQKVVAELRRRTNQLRDEYGEEFSARMWKTPTE